MLGTEVVVVVVVVRFVPGGIRRPGDETIYRGYCPLGEPEVAIHATNLLYDIAPSRPLARRLVHPLPLPSPALLALTLIPLRPFIFALSWPSVFFSRVIRGARKCARARVFYPAPYGEIADSLAINSSFFFSPSTSLNVVPSALLLGLNGLLFRINVSITRDVLCPELYPHCTIILFMQ